MRRETLYLQDIIEACDLLDTFLEGMDASAFMSSELHKAAALQKLAVIGEAAARLRRSFARNSRRWNGATSSRSETSPFTLTSPCSGTLFGQQPMTMFPYSEVRS